MKAFAEIDKQVLSSLGWPSRKYLAVMGLCALLMLGGADRKSTRLNSSH